MLHQGQQIRHDLARMRLVGQSVDDRHAGVMRQFLDLGVIVGADHDRIDHAAEHPCGIGDGFAAAQLHPARFHDNGAAAQLPHRHIERNARAGGIFLENHGQYAPRQWCIGIGATLGPIAPRRFAVQRIAQHRRHGIAAGIAQIKKMPGHHAVCTGS
jgi:hypothetical protein